MSPDTEMVLLFGGLHLIGLAFGLMLLVMFMRSQPTAGVDFSDDDSADGGGGGGSDRPAPLEPRGKGGDGLPLPDALQARRRLRGPGRLGEEWRPGRAWRRRPNHAPDPVRPLPVR